MYKKILITALGLFITINIIAQHKTENLVIVTLDGMRWQEVFSGADTTILKIKKFTKAVIRTNASLFCSNTNGSNNSFKKLIISITMSILNIFLFILFYNNPLVTKSPFPLDCIIFKIHFFRKTD